MHGSNNHRSTEKLMNLVSNELIYLTELFKFSKFKEKMLSTNKTHQNAFKYYI